MSDIAKAVEAVVGLLEKVVDKKIVKDTSRTLIASVCMAGYRSRSGLGAPTGVAKLAVWDADALLAELERTKEKEE